MKISPASLNSAKDKMRGRLVCFPYAGGGASAYYRWPELILPDLELIRITLPGHEHRIREPLVKNIGEIIEKVSDELRFITEEPYAMFGHSMGAIIAFETCREFRRKKLPLPDHLFAAGYRAPQLPDTDNPITHLPNHEFLEKVCAYGGMPQGILNNKELLDIFVPILKADYQIIESYQYAAEPPLNCSITTFGGIADQKVSSRQIVEWEKQTKKEFKSRFFDGGHFFIKNRESELVGEINLILKK